jgi:hypothetical protein
MNNHTHIHRTSFFRTGLLSRLRAIGKALIVRSIFLFVRVTQAMTFASVSKTLTIGCPKSLKQPTRLGAINIASNGVIKRYRKNG